MKLMQEDQVILGNTAKSTSFKINSSSKAFKILSSNLYKNKVRAIVRELTCNALDAHRLAGNTDVPFEIKAPTMLDPRFIVRDFGPGMSDEDINELYTTYFASTKDTSNDFTGALGLGSKSPFSYTETFSVTSYYGGMIRGYVALLMNGEPVLKPTFTEKMKEGDRTGLEVVVPVKSNDISRWHDEIAYCLRPFGEYDPIIKGMNFDKDTYLPNKDIFTNNDFVNNEESSGAYAVYGNIVYPLEDVPEINYTWLTCNVDCIYFRFPLGELDIAPSREELSLDEQTIANIIKHVNGLNKAKFEEDIKDITDSKTNREFLRKLDSYEYHARRTIEANLPTFNGVSVNVIRDMEDKKVKKLAEWYFGKRIYTADSRCCDLRRITNKLNHTSSMIISSAVFGHTKENIYILVDDVKNKNIIATIRGLVTAEKVPYRHPVIVAHKDSVEEYKAVIIEHLGEDVNIITFNASELEDVRMMDHDYAYRKSTPKEKRADARPSLPNVVHYKYNAVDDHFTSTELRLTSKEIQELDTSIPVGVQYRDALHDYNTMERRVKEGFYEIRELCVELNMHEFYLVRNNAVERMKKLERVNMFDVLFERLEEYFNDCITNKKFALPSNISNVINNIRRVKRFAFIGEKYLGATISKTYKQEKLEEAQLLIKGTIPESLRKARNEYDFRCKECETTAREKLSEFRSQFPIVHYYMNSHGINERGSYELEIEQIVKFFKEEEVK